MFFSFPPARFLPVDVMQTSSKSIFGTASTMTQPLDMEMLSLNLAGLVNAKRFMARGGLLASQTIGAADLIFSTNDSSAVCGKDEEVQAESQRSPHSQTHFYLLSSWIPKLPETTQKAILSVSLWTSRSLGNNNKLAAAGK